ncbi:MAG TPA: trypsin-like peptidase domain-containing protein [Acetobacteraceae bacterium]|nr:trypsin-like peptidase domain-containing protein [Acetobacteraceae bacterium]
MIRLAALLAAGVAIAQPRPGLDEADPRRPLNPRVAPWNAIGRVETAAGGRCTGALVARDLVLTAAHCLVDPARGRLVPAGTARFVPEGAAPILAASYRIGHGFNPVREEPWRADWAFVRLVAEAPARIAPLPLLRDAPSAGQPLALAAWQHDRPEVLSADLTCRVRGLATYGGQGLMLQHDCAGTFGSSGAPLLARGAEGRWAILGVQAKAALGQRFGVAVPALALPMP